MAKKSPLSVALHASFDEHFVPLLHRLGFEVVKPKNVKPGMIVASATRKLEGPGRIEAMLWCDNIGGNLRFRFDLVEPFQGEDCWGQINLEVPWPDPAYRNLFTLDFSGKEFRPHESLARLSTAIAFLAGGFAANAETLASAVPELAESVRVASAEPEWQAAVARAEMLWKTRHAPSFIAVLEQYQAK